MYDLRIDDTQITALLNRTDRAAQNVFKRAMRAALKVFRQAAAGFAASRGYPSRWTNPNRGFRTSVRTAQTFSSSSGARTVSGFQILGKLFTRHPGNIYEAGQREHWIKVTPALIRWAKKKGIPTVVFQRGLWFTAKARAWRTGKKGRARFTGRRWFVPFAATPDGRLERWAEAKGLDVKQAMLVHRQPPRPIVKPAAASAVEQARAEFIRIIQEWVEASRG